ncbi:MAG TPA: helix-turn-helix domain-containing protein [Candidatus Kapabacteria bacterium]|nr:helix-turn-helix domain-containing protein [Candidatus Kapabacteria bacterium]
MSPFHEKSDVLRKKAIQLRKKGYTYPAIEGVLGVSRSTLSGWLHAITLSEKVKQTLVERKKENLKKARVRALKVLALQYQKKRDQARSKAEEVLNSLPLNHSVKEALLAMLYIGEGFKRRSVVGLGNSNPSIVSLFVQLLCDVYQVDKKSLRCFLFLRHDQVVEKEERYWSRMLGISRSQFRKAQSDIRTIGKKTRDGYHGVCAVYCYDATIEKRLTAFQSILVEKMIKK